MAIAACRIPRFLARWAFAAVCTVGFVGEAGSADLERGAKTFRSCAGCHTVEGERSTFGPSLKGVVGRTAGAVNDYSYSPAMKKAGEQGLVWTDENLADFLAKPSRKVPGNQMRFWGLWGFEIDDLIDFLKANP